MMKTDESFSRFDSMGACTLEMRKLGHSPEDCETICNQIHERAEKGLLYKAAEDGLTLLSKAEDRDIVVGGWASWDNIDDEGDQITVEAQAKALERFFNMQPEYQSITVNHKEFKVAQPLLKYKAADGTEYFSHVNEKGTYLISKIRNDSLKTTQYYREEARKGNLNGYSITGLPLEKAADNPKRVLDIEYHSITLTEKSRMKPINPMSRDVKVLAKADCSGDCDTSKCGGACCTFITQHLERCDADVKAYLTLHDLESKSDGNGGLFVKFPITCKAFDSVSKACSVHDKRPDICRIYPQQESPFIAKANCTLLQKRMGVLCKSEAVSPTLNTEKSVSLEKILKKHGFT